MATRTPGASTVFPNGQARQQYHHYWGQYATETALPNNGANALSLAQFTLEAGDVAFVTGTGTLWLCTDPGAATANDATWIEFAVSMAQTIRDAHEIVVDIDTTAPVPPAPAPAVGVTCDYLDAGDGVQLEAAIAAVAAAAATIDVRIRAGVITIGAAVVTPLEIPDNCRLIGAGAGGETVLIPKQMTATVAPDLFVLGTQSAIEHIEFDPQAPNVAADMSALATFGIIRLAGSDASVRECSFFASTAGTGSNNPPMIIALSGAVPIVDPTAESCPPAIIVANITMELPVDPTTTPQTGARQAYGIQVGLATQVSMGLGDGAESFPTITEVNVNGGHASVRFFNTAGGLVRSHQHLRQFTDDAIATDLIGGMVLWSVSGTPASVGTVQGVTVDGFTFTSDTAGDTATVMGVGIDLAPAVAATVFGSRVTSGQMRFQTSGERTAIILRSSTATADINVSLSETVISAVSSRGHSEGIRMFGDASVDTAGPRIHNAVVTGCMLPFTRTVAIGNRAGLHLLVTGTANTPLLGQIQGVHATGCCFSGHRNEEQVPDYGIFVEVDDNAGNPLVDQIQDTFVVACNLRTATGTPGQAYRNTGNRTEIAHCNGERPAPV